MAKCCATASQIGCTHGVVIAERDALIRKRRGALLGTANHWRRTSIQKQIRQQRLRRIDGVTGKIRNAGGA